jgi:hypothetical protein
MLVEAQVHTVGCMGPQHPLRRLLTSLLVLATFATAAAGMLLRNQVVGIALITGAALSAICAWYALGAPIRRGDIGQGASSESN